MFTGIVESVGRVAALARHELGARLELENVTFASELSLGESVAVNGCCLTVVAWSNSAVSFDLLEQTLQVTNLGRLAAGSLVNLERAMQATSRFSGHFVQGHVDTVGVVQEYVLRGQDHCFRVLVPGEFKNLLVGKGSITIDGISLTVAELSDEQCDITMWITPHTHSVTTLSELKPGRTVNLEFDVIAKHIDRMLAARLG
jgi:riboflavin synthase